MTTLLQIFEISLSAVFSLVSGSAQITLAGFSLGSDLSAAACEISVDSVLLPVCFTQEELDQRQTPYMTHHTLLWHEDPLSLSRGLIQYCSKKNPPSYSFGKT